MIPPEQLAVTLLYLLPGFLALKVFYTLGLRRKRSDLEWTLWSLLAAAPLGALAMFIWPRPGEDHVRISIALVLAIVVGVVLVVSWRAAISRWPDLRSRAAARAWDSILPQAEWVQVWTTDGKVVSGAPRVIALSTETETVDLYLEKPAWVDPATGKLTEMTGVEGFLIPAESVAHIQVLVSDP